MAFVLDAWLMINATPRSDNNNIKAIICDRKIAMMISAFTKYPKATATNESADCDQNWVGIVILAIVFKSCHQANFMWLRASSSFLAVTLMVLRRLS